MKTVASYSKRRDQRGMAAILITMITMIVISLIVLGFANVARREQGQSLDRQLSTQAFYSAESGIEDARAVISKAVDAGKAVPAKSDCATNDAAVTSGGYPVVYPTGTQTQVGSGSGASYSCLLVDPNPTSLQYNGVGADSVVIPVNAANPAAAISRVEVTWSPSTTPDACAKTNGGTCSSGSTRCLDAGTNVANTSTARYFLSATNWTCQYGLMRMDIVPTAANVGGQALTRNRLMNGQVAGFFVPTQNTTATGQMQFATAYNQNLSSGNPQATYTKAKCDGTTYGACKATITNMTATNQYAFRISSLYEKSNVTVIAYDSAGNPMALTGAQAVIDSTGKAQDVLRRIVARVPVNASKGQVPGYAIQSNGSLCKRFETTPGYLKIPDNFPTGNSDAANNAMCAQRTDGSPQTGG